jgi:6-pyruvoyltetrahydropterin/6-carboxytetrahydropterin synthase
MITIAKQFTFDAAHHLPTMPEGHKCRRLHGHTYGVELQLRGMPGANGLFVDYEDIAKAWAPIHEQIDHRLLNEIPGLAVPTTEVLCLWLFGKLELHLGEWLTRIRVSESSTTWAELTRTDYERLHDMIGRPPFIECLLRATVPAKVP